MVQTSIASVFNVKVLYLAGCRSAPLTIKLVQKMAEKLGIPVALEEILVTSAEQAAELKFPGSPTVRINGMDIEPLARSVNYFGLA